MAEGLVRRVGEAQWSVILSTLFVIPMTSQDIGRVGRAVLHQVSDSIHRLI